MCLTTSLQKKLTKQATKPNKYFHRICDSGPHFTDWREITTQFTHDTVISTISTISFIVNMFQKYGDGKNLGINIHLYASNSDTLVI